jgi:hypothetical protein
MWVQLSFNNCVLLKCMLTDDAEVGAACWSGCVRPEEIGCLRRGVSLFEARTLSSVRSMKLNQIRASEKTQVNTVLSKSISRIRGLVSRLWKRSQWILSKLSHCLPIPFISVSTFKFSEFYFCQFPMFHHVRAVASYSRWSSAKVCRKGPPTSINSSKCKQRHSQTFSISSFRSHKALRDKIMNKSVFYFSFKLKFSVSFTNVFICPCQYLNSFGSILHCGQSPGLNPSKHDELQHTVPRCVGQTVNTCTTWWLQPSYQATSECGIFSSACWK